MAFYQFKEVQQLPISIEEAWDFISSPENLKEITPPEMGFTVTSKNHSPKMYEGMIITYKVKPLAGIAMDWMTEITHVKPMQYFVDEQRVGPYTIWHHEHHLEPIEGGVLMTDIVTYAPPFGWLGAIANAVIIKRQLQTIFNYRRKVLEARFGSIQK